jgi:16S rRNA G966 N2-methylase RsmD
VEEFDLLDDGGLLVIEHMKGYKFSEGCTVLALQSTRNYGQTCLSFFARQEASG